MSALPKTTMASRHQVPREWDGLTGRTEDERREIQSRIERVSALKGRLGGRVLTPFEVALALGADRRDPRRRCTGCKSVLPATAEYFHRAGRGYLDSRCKSCACRHHGRRDKTRQFTAEQRERRREADRRRYANRTAADRPELTARQRLLRYRRLVKSRLRKATNPAVIERCKATIANLTHEIDRLEKGGGA